MTKVLLVGGPKHGEIVTWPRPDNHPCRFPNKNGPRDLYTPTDPYFRNKIVDYRVAFCGCSFLYGEEILNCLNTLENLSADELNLVRDKNDPEKKDSSRLR